MALNPTEVDDMHHAIRLFESLLRLLLPATGRHRPTDAAPRPVRCTDVPRSARRRAPARHTELLQGEDSALVRPYLVAYERQQCCERLQRIHAMGVAAAW
ncbi:hypothetical protein DY245_13810 [Streptomyces inhibens]|uniref:Uncharacterized protein n=1 Tax=Streptomyces inhibens TaxID=2293571 RepID=A0A371Q4U6_STRIH|nr:hypothetical protein DY245_13810 [Streptomyces inhibens]